MAATSFITTAHALNNTTELDENFDAIETPCGDLGFIGIELYPHQAVVVKAMLDLEDRRVIKVPSDAYNHVTNQPVVIQFSGMVLSEPFGSGKTYDLIALILMRPLPRAVPEYTNSIVLKDVVTGARRQRQTKESFKHEISRIFTGENALIRSNLIVVGSSVIEQWRRAFLEHTKLNVLTVRDYYELKRFQKIYNERKLSTFHVVLIKNGNVTGTFVLPDEKPEEKRDNRSMVTAVAKITANSCWARAIYDDFDTIHIPSDAYGINALFSIYVSATRKEGVPTKKRLVSYETIEQALTDRRVPLNNILADRTLFTNGSIRNNQEFVERSTNIPIINKFRYVYANPDDNYIRLMGAMGEDQANQVMEMLNGDAIGAAAAAMGIKTDSVADIFKRMLDKQYEKFLHDKAVLENIDEIRANVVPMLEPHPEGKRHSMHELDQIRSAIVKKTIPKIAYYSVAIDQLLDELHAEYTAAFERDGLAINRVKDNIRSGTCQVCCMPLQNMDTFIVRCCGLIVCDICGIKGNQIGKRYDYKTKTETLVGSCGNCKAVIYPQKDLIFVDASFDIDQLLVARGDEKPEPIPEPEPVAAEAEPEEPAEPEIKNPKLKALVEIIRGKNPEGQEVLENVKIKHLLEGRVDLPPPEDLPRKVLVFANYNETLGLIENTLRERNIEFLRLGGTYREMADTVKEFQKSSASVLLVNSQHHCAGLNIQFATDEVFFHKILDGNIEAQVAGRAQRIGRKHNLRLHYLLYRNEKNLM